MPRALSSAPTSLTARLAQPQVLLLDGGTGGALEDRGVDVRNPLWSSVALLSPPGRALDEALHHDYLDAGAEILIANTHNASLQACQQFLADPPPGLDLEAIFSARDPADALLRRLHEEALQSTRRAAGARAWAAGCLASPQPPYSRADTLTGSQVASRLRPQWEVMLQVAPDLVIFEMLTTEADIRGVSSLDLSAAPMPLAAGLVCGADGHLLSGFDAREAARILAGAGVGWCFIQCTRYDIAHVALERLAEVVGGLDLVMGVYANDARTWQGRAWCGARVTPEAYAAAARTWVDLGARAVGGCCGTDPAHIEALRYALRM